MNHKPYVLRIVLVVTGCSHLCWETLYIEPVRLNIWSHTINSVAASKSLASRRLSGWYTSYAIETEGERSFYFINIDLLASSERCKAQSDDFRNLEIFLAVGIYWRDSGVDDFMMYEDSNAFDLTSKNVRDLLRCLGIYNTQLQPSELLAGTLLAVEPFRGPWRSVEL